MKQLFILLALLIVCSCQSGNSTDETAFNEEQIPLREMRSKEDFKELIVADSAWYSTVKQKAIERDISVEEMIEIDALYMVAIDSEIVIIQNIIIGDPAWLSLVKKKAKENGVSLDEMLLADADFIYNSKKDTLQ